MLSLEFAFENLNNKALLSPYTYLALSWRRPLSYRNQSIDLQSKSMDSFLYDNGLRHERVNHTLFLSYIPLNSPLYLQKYVIPKYKRNSHDQKRLKRPWLNLLQNFCLFSIKNWKFSSRYFSALLLLFSKIFSSLILY